MIVTNEMINEVALKCCKKMTEKERTAFFKYQKQIRKQPNAWHRKYEIDDTYFNGPRKGELKVVYEVDGHVFNKLWDLIMPYVLTSVRCSFIYRPGDPQIEEDMFDIKTQIFYLLRFHGGGQEGYPFSSAFKAMIGQILKNSARRRGAPTNAKVLDKEKAPKDALRYCAICEHQNMVSSFKRKKGLFLCPECGSGMQYLKKDAAGVGKERGNRTRVNSMTTSLEGLVEKVHVYGDVSVRYVPQLSTGMEEFDLIDQVATLPGNLRKIAEEIAYSAASVRTIAAARKTNTKKLRRRITHALAVSRV